MIKEMEILKLGVEPYEIVDRKSRDDLANVMAEVANTKTEVANAVKKPLRAEVGQALIVKAVDENGVPTEFEAGTVAGKEEYDAVITMTTETDADGDNTNVLTLATGDFESLKTKIMSYQTLKITISGYMDGYAILNPLAVIYDDIHNMIVLITDFGLFGIAPDNTVTILS